uniref:Uncharacterized protein n=1 Tax=Meloidogyne javanica TaxID=6303 RepID=A0A915MAF3_MELJA
MEVDGCTIEEISKAIDVGSSEFRQMVGRLASAFGLVQHPDPLITLKAIEARMSAINEQKLHLDELKKNPHQINPLNTVPLVDDGVCLLRLLHGARIRELQTKINELMADVQKVTASPRCDLSLGRVGR